MHVVYGLKKIKKHFKCAMYKLFAILTLIVLFESAKGLNTVNAATKATGISAFPSSYQIYLKQLQKLHPNWTFTALNTGINWNVATKSEGPNGGFTDSIKKSAVPVSFSDVWKWKNNQGKYNTIETGWVTASELAISYTMEPRKYLNEMQIFQFETLNYDSTTQNQDGVEKIFYGTLMYKSNVTYIDTNGKAQTINKTYSKIVMEAAAKYGVSPYHLASRIKQETGCDIQNNTSIKGNVSGYVGIYNYYNIGATGGDSAAISGLAYARREGWTTPELAIMGGAEFLAEKYISKGQHTTYLQKFNVNDDSSYALYTHQYMQNILAPSSEAITTYNAYSKMGLLNIPFNFLIPVYTNMSDYPVDIYVQNENDYVKDSTKVYCTSNLNLRSGAGTGNSVILTVPSGTIMTRIARGVQAGERWDKVRLDSGVEGYVFQSYIKEYSYVKVNGVSLSQNAVEVNPGNTITLSAAVSPSNAKYKEVKWSSSNSSVAEVSENGVVTAKNVGTATIAVTTDDQLKTDTCQVNVVKKKDPSISLDKSTYNIIKDKECAFTVTISDWDILQYDILVEDENVAKIENDRIKALSEGTTKLIVNIKDTSIKTEALIKVIDVGENEIIIDDGINIDGDLMSNINEKTNVKQIKDKIQTVHNIVIKNGSGENLKDEEYIGTGAKVKIVNSAGEIMYEYTIVIYGDVTGDGKITSKDYMMIKNHIMETSILTGVEAMAADAYADNKITSKDYMAIKNHIMETSLIVQR